MSEEEHQNTLRKMGAPVSGYGSVSVSCPPELEHLKNQWLQCHRDKVLTYQELFYFQRVMCVDLEPGEVEIVMNIDNLYWKYN